MNEAKIKKLVKQLKGLDKEIKKLRRTRFTVTKNNINKALVAAKNARDVAKELVAECGASDAAIRSGIQVSPEFWNTQIAGLERLAVNGIARVKEK